MGDDAGDHRASVHVADTGSGHGHEKVLQIVRETTSKSKFHLPQRPRPQHEGHDRRDHSDELYAVAALAGAAVVVFGDAVFPRSAPIAAIGGIVCVGLRLIAVRRGWKLPVAQQPD